VRARRGFELRRPLGPSVCGECGEAHEELACPCCGEQPEGAWLGTLQTEVVSGSGRRWLVTAQRDRDTGGWSPVRREALPGTWVGQVDGEAR
jgi:hypothetical protein